MSSLTEYLLGQIAQATQLLQSGQRETNDKLDKLAEKLDDRLTDLEQQYDEKRQWEQRLVWMAIALFMAVFMNWSPEKMGEVLASALRGLK
jgi:uncharacterized phage infection (PIP) family protein YhgE